MFKFLVAIVSLVLFAHDSFATCEPGYYEQSVDFTAPTSNGDSYGYYGHGGSNKSDYTSPVNLSEGQWRVTWTSSGTVVGEASCNGTNGTYAVTTSPSDSMSNSANGPYCWCKVTQWIPNSGSSYDLSAAWVFFKNYNTASMCGNLCPVMCARYVEDTSDLRSPVFGTVQLSTTCTACPNGGTSTGTGGITNCYIPSTTNFTDSKGTYHFTNACYYQ